MDKIILDKLMLEVMVEVDKAIFEGNSPFAAFLVDEDGVVKYKAHNTSNTDYDPTAHAEIKLIKKACKDLKTKDLSQFILISNAWSCSMCMSACIKAKIKIFVFGAPSENNMNPNITIFDIEKKTNQKINIITDVLKDKCQKQIAIARQRNHEMNGVNNDR